MVRGITASSGGDGDEVMNGSMVSSILWYLAALEHRVDGVYFLVTVALRDNNDML